MIFLFSYDYILILEKENIGYETISSFCLFAFFLMKSQL